MPKDNVLIPEDLRPLLRQKARHEYGHLISARAMGFPTGEVTLRILSLEGHHIGTSEVMIHQPLREMSAIQDYIERRVVILFSGAMAEAACENDVGGDYVEQICFRNEGAAHDHGKIEELIGLHMNVSQPGKMSAHDVIEGRSRLYAELRRRSAALVKKEYALIADLAAQHEAKLVELNLGWG